MSVRDDDIDDDDKDGTYGRDGNGDDNNNDSHANKLVTVGFSSVGMSQFPSVRRQRASTTEGGWGPDGNRFFSHGERHRGRRMTGVQTDPGRRRRRRSVFSGRLGFFILKRWESTCSSPRHRCVGLRCQPRRNLQAATARCAENSATEISSS